MSVFHESHVLIDRKECPNATFDAFRETLPNALFTPATVDYEKQGLVADLTPSLVDDGAGMAMLILVVSGR
jgi:hypothetical protein